MSSSDKRKEASKIYDKNNTTGVYLKLNRNTDADILEKLNEVPAKQTYIKKLIRSDISCGQEDTE